MRVLRTRVTLAPSVTLVRSMALTCAPVRTAIKVSTVLKISTNAKPVRRANTTDCASTLLDRSVVTAPEVSPVLVAKSTSTNAIRILARTMALVWTNEELSVASACQVRCFVVVLLCCCVVDFLSGCRVANWQSRVAGRIARL